MNVLRQAGKEKMNCTLEIVQRMHRSDADSWEREIKTRLMVPLHKKGDRKEISNYRGVCLLSMVSRILARIMAKRWRSWIDDIGYIGDTQCGFRTGISSADAAQIIIRVNEEVER